MSTGVFLFGLVIFATVAVLIRHYAMEQAAESRKKTVPEGAIVVEDSGKILRAGDRYTPAPAEQLSIPLGPRLVHATHEAGKHGVADYLYMQATYRPDEANLPQFVRAVKEAGGVDKLHTTIQNAIAGKLCLSREDDFSDLRFSNVESAYGIRITHTETKPRLAVEREKERVSGFDRYVQSVIAKIGTQRAAIVWIAEEMKKAEQETDPQVRQFLLDILQNAADRLKTAG